MCKGRRERLVEKVLPKVHRNGVLNYNGQVDDLSGEVGDAEALGPVPRDSTLFQFTTRRLRDFIDPDHLLIRIDEQFDFARLVAPLEDRYCSDNGRPRHPPGGDGQGVAHLLSVQHLLLPEIEFRHRREHCLSLVLFPHHR